MFILTKDKTIVITPLQTLLVIYINGNYKRQWYILREKIRDNEIGSITELLEFNRPRIGGISQIQGLVLENTKLSRHVDISAFENMVSQ